MMSDHTSIEWTDATWNPVTGCTKVSPGCDHCYAETFAERFRGTPGHYFENGFDVQLRENKLTEPLRWRKPRKVFVNSMSDLFHDAVPDEYIAQVWAVMALAPQHTFQVLTKRHARMRTLLTSGGFQTAVAEHILAMTDADEMKDAGDPFPLPNVWLGVSTENQQWADIRIPALLDTPAAVRFISAEPLLGPISIYSNSNLDREDAQLDWVIVGGESGHGARPMHPSWVRSLRYECSEEARSPGDTIPFLFKQWGAWVPESMNIHGVNAPAAFLSVEGWTRPLVNGKPTEPPMSRGQDITVRRVGKGRAGRVLDGRTWDEFPDGDR
ncbi:hypothetical protein SEA_LILAS_64 [Gordonia phage Lilas]|nr:hypothetical protein SEA_LILAS_64 [Gordonia phage Lilas]QAY17591.1 hypothetical protein SEA_BRADISSA_64 [Gordonia phage Bradissa]